MVGSLVVVAFGNLVEVGDGHKDCFVVDNRIPFEAVVGIRVRPVVHTYHIEVDMAVLSAVYAYQIEVDMVVLFVVYVYLAEADAYKEIDQEASFPFLDHDPFAY